MFCEAQMTIKTLCCSETSLTGESQFHISSPKGFEPVTLVAGSNQVSPLDQWDMMRIMWDCRLSTMLLKAMLRYTCSRIWESYTPPTAQIRVNWDEATKLLLNSNLRSGEPGKSLWKIKRQLWPAKTEDWARINRRIFVYFVRIFQYSLMEDLLEHDAAKMGHDGCRDPRPGYCGGNIYANLPR